MLLPNANEVTLQDMGKSSQSLTKSKRKYFIYTRNDIYPSYLF